MRLIKRNTEGRDHASGAKGLALHDVCVAVESAGALAGHELAEPLGRSHVRLLLVDSVRDGQRERGRADGGRVGHDAGRGA